VAKILSTLEGNCHQIFCVIQAKNAKIIMLGQAIPEL